MLAYMFIVCCGCVDVTKLKTPTMDTSENPVSVDELLAEPINIQAQKADPICVHNCQDVEFATEQLDDAERNPRFEIWNKNSVGNIARMILSAPTPELRRRYEILLQRFREHRRQVRSRVKCAQWSVCMATFLIVGIACSQFYRWAFMY
jgi:hypothetical protein